VGLPYFYVDGPAARGASVSLAEDDARHAVRSLRLRPGDEITVTDGRGWVATCRLLEPEGAGAAAEVIEETIRERPRPRIAVVVALPKGDRAWWAVQKLTELGVDEIVLAEAERSVRTGGKALERARTVAREAAKQSRRAWLPELQTAPALLERAGTGHPILCYERATRPLASVLPETPSPDAVTLIVGPEGGISEDELERAERAGIPTASLGGQNLRTETAAVAAASIALHRYGRLG
jgi:16S rRNA (uracil1498-N3)-methyltransferase